MLPHNNNLTNQQRVIQRLTALWALSESGLGGMMFALKIPFTGFFVGGFAVIMLALIAHFSNNNYKKILEATVIVLMVKAVVSPHSPPPAYIAVAFQGLVAALFFHIISSHKIASILLGIVSMAESAVQKIIILTILFGKKLWEAIDALFTQISKEFSITVHKDYALWLIVLYIIIYIFWGIIVGRWAATIPVFVSQKKEIILREYDELTNRNPAIKTITASNKKVKRITSFIAILIFVIGMFLLSGANGKTVLFILGRSIAALLLLYFILKPILQWLIQKWLQNRPGTQKQAANDIINLLPQMKTFAGAAFSMAGNEENYFKRLRKFITYLITLSLYAE